MTKVLTTITYASVVPRVMVRIALVIAALIDHHVKSSDILNAYVQAYVTERCGLNWVQSSVKMQERQQ